MQIDKQKPSLQRALVQWVDKMDKLLTLLIIVRNWRHNQPNNNKQANTVLEFLRMQAKKCVGRIIDKYKLKHSFLPTSKATDPMPCILNEGSAIAIPRRYYAAWHDSLEALTFPGQSGGTTEKQRGGTMKNRPHRDIITWSITSIDVGFSITATRNRAEHKEDESEDSASEKERRRCRCAHLSVHRLVTLTATIHSNQFHREKLQPTTHIRFLIQINFTQGSFFWTKISSILYRNNLITYVI